MVTVPVGLVRVILIEQPAKLITKNTFYMKAIIMNSKFALLLIAGIFALSGFDRPGAHSVQISIDNELIQEMYVHSRSKAPAFQLDPSKNYKELTVRYNECGRTVDGRRLTLTDKNGQELKTWRFEGATAGFKDAMTCQVKDMLSFAKAGNNELRLSYASNDFPEGSHILTLEVKSLATASGQ